MSGISDYLANKLLDHALGGPDYTRPSTVYLELFLVMPGSDGSGGTPVSTADYARLPIACNETNFSSAASRLKHNAVALTWSSGPVNNWGTIVGAALYDAASGGNMLWVAEFSVAKVVNAGDTAFSIPANGGTFSAINS